MAARLAPHDVRQTHQSLHHLVAHAPWSDEALLQQVRQSVLPQMEQDGPVIAWIVDDTGFLKKGTHSVGVARQYCGQIGKQINCQIAVSLSIATEHASLPVAWRLTYRRLGPKMKNAARGAGVPKVISFQSKWPVALEQIRKAVRDGIPAAPTLADAAYGDNYDFREGIAGAALAVRGRRSGTYDHVGTGRIPAAPETAEREEAPRHAAPSRPATSTCFREGIGGILGTSESW
jgi:SRSO17 transposase